MSRISSPPSSGGSSAAAGASSPQAESHAAAPHETGARSAAQPHSPTGPAPRAASRRGAQQPAPAGDGMSRQDQLRQRFSAVAGPRSSLAPARSLARASPLQSLTGSLADHSTAEPGGGPGMMGGSSSLLGHAGHEPAGPPQGRIPEGTARRYSSELAGPPQGRIPEGTARRYSSELAGPGGGAGMMGSPAESAHDADASASHGGSSSDGSSFLGGSFVHPLAPLHLNLPMGGGAGDTNSTGPLSSDFRIPTAQQPPDAPQPATPSASEAHSGPVSTSASHRAAGYEADDGGRGR